MKKWNSVLANLAISHVTAVFVVVMLLSSAFYIILTKNYKEELLSKNQIRMKNTVQTIESAVLKRVQQIHLDISLDKNVNLRLFTDSSYANHRSEVIELKELIQSKVTNNSDLIHAVHLYYPKQRIMLSSSQGLRFNADEGSEFVYFEEWVSGMRTSNKSSLWTKARLVPQDIYSNLHDTYASEIVTYVHSYPFQSSGQLSELLIAIDVKESAISSIVKDILPADYQNTLILNSSGTTISDTSKGNIGVLWDHDTGIQKVLMSKNESGSFLETIHHTDYIASYHTFMTTGWKIYSAEPASTFYKLSNSNLKLIIGISLFATLIGFVLSGILAFVSYHPIKRTVMKIKHFTDHSPNLLMTDELGLIDYAFDELTNKVSSLEDTILTNSPVIKHNVVLNMLRNSYSSEELAKEISLLFIPPLCAHYCCLLVSIDETVTAQNSPLFSHLMNSLNIEALQEPLHKYHVISAMLTNNKIAIIICTDKQNNQILDRVSSRIISGREDQWNQNSKVSWGSWVTELKDIHISYNEAEVLMKYGYFLPGQSILKDHKILDRENNHDEISQSLFSQFRDKLQARQAALAIESVDRLIQVLHEGNYSAHHCHFALANILFIYCDYLKCTRYKPFTDEKTDLYQQQYLQIKNVQDFRDWLADSIAVFMNKIEKRASERSVASIELAKQYIEVHLSEDLSLDIVAAKVFISPKYMSRLFKEELGVTFTEYVTSKRLEKAKTMIERDNMTIEQIASTVGYGTSAYFIKKFKETYGCTPGNYMRSMAEYSSETKLA
ncbi:AraC family transcriptional regulator [Paenibacillus sp. GYB006]|uniref:AraC family transcriptional regulator n=1 Tax=Paenibacillus sp. GYB006 TaxID=2994394 RepID=UPI002F960BF6